MRRMMFDDQLAQFFTGFEKCDGGGGIRRHLLLGPDIATDEAMGKIVNRPPEIRRPFAVGDTRGDLFRISKDVASIFMFAFCPG